MKSSGARFVNLATLAVVNLMWAGQYAAYKIASDHIDVLALNFWTFLIAAILLTPFWLRQRGRGARLEQCWRGRIAVEFVVLALLGLLPPSVLLAWGIAHSSASNAAILSLTIPVLMVVMGWLLLKERLTRLRLASLALALAGTVLVSRSDLAGGSFSLALLAGNLAIFLGGAGSAFYNVFSKRLLERFNELEVLIYGYFVAILCCALLSALYDRRPFYHAESYPLAAWGALVVLGGLSWGLAMVLWMWVLNRLAVSQISVSVYLLPVFGVVITSLVLREKLTVLHLAGGACVIAATFLTSEYEAWRLKRASNCAVFEEAER
ncbi:MAG: DMT family transporter [Bryobacteraceae bacterium]|jgi:drug/metabolite transporter (DMT)-like permease